MKSGQQRLSELWEWIWNSMQIILTFLLPGRSLYKILLVNYYQRHVNEFGILYNLYCG